MLQEESMADLVKFLLDQVSYFEWLEDREPERAEDKKRNLVELMEAMRDFEREQADEEQPGAPVDFEGGATDDDLVADSQIGGLLRQFLEQSSLVRDADEEEGGETVTLMTVHGAKGLEFDTVFLVGMEENLFPNVRDSDDKEELYEERRLAYVAITRAEEKLFITNARRRRLWGNLMRTEPSRFLLDIDEERIDFDPRSSAQEIDYGTKPRPWRETGSGSGGAGFYGGSSSSGNSWNQSGSSSDDDFAQTYGEAVQGAVDGSDDDQYFSQVAPEEGASEAEREAASSDSAGKKSGDELVGATVTHSKFGIGEILSVSARGNRTRLTINFPKVGEKTVVRDFVKVLG
jgi:DNA helicase-2/ATP-dependent DNA helicase PcrA